MRQRKKVRSAALTKGSHNIHQSEASAASVVSSSCLKSGDSDTFSGLNHTALVPHNDSYFEKLEVMYPCDKQVAVCQSCEHQA